MQAGADVLLDNARYNVLEFLVELGKLLDRMVYYLLRPLVDFAAFVLISNDLVLLLGIGGLGENCVNGLLRELFDLLVVEVHLFIVVWVLHFNLILIQIHNSNL